MADPDKLYEYRQQIEEEVDKHIDCSKLAAGSYNHNIVSIVLRQVSKEFGVNVANGLVDEYELDEVFGIQKINK